MRTARALTFADAGLRRRTARRAYRRRDPRRFGRAVARELEPQRERRWSLSDDMQLFAATFAAGFVFVSILIS